MPLGLERKEKRKKKKIRQQESEDIKGGSQTEF